MPVTPEPAHAEGLGSRWRSQAGLGPQPVCVQPGISGRRQAARARGFLARVRVQPFSEGTILPHEETFSGPKADRLRLMEATGMNLSPVFGLYSDTGREVQSRLDAATAGQPPAEATDDLGVVGRLWPVSDQHVISQVAGLMGPRKILIADGHHRYETSVAYRDQALGAAVNQPGDEPARYTLMHFVAMQDPGLIVLPTHRLVRGVGRLDSTSLAQAARSPFLDANGQQPGRSVGPVVHRGWTGRPRFWTGRRHLGRGSTARSGDHV